MEATTGQIHSRHSDPIVLSERRGIITESRTQVSFPAQ